MRSLTAAGRTGPWVLAAIVAVSLARSSLAQQEPNLDRIRKTPFTTNADRQSVTDWAQRLIDELFSVDKPVIAGALFYRRMTEDFSAADATPGFKDGLAEILAEAFASRYQPRASGPEATNPVPVVFVLAVLRVYQRPSAFEGFQRALADPAAGVRLMAAVGLGAIREKIDDQQWTAMLANVQKAGVAETDPVVLGRMYGLLRAQAASRVAAAVPVMLAILDARMTRFETKGGWPVPADGQAAVWLGDKTRAINDARTRTNAVRQIGRLLADGVHAFTKQNPPETYQTRLEEAIESTEKGLRMSVAAILTNNPLLPDVTKAMLQGGPSRADNMQLELNNWMGTDQVPGVLNKPPFNFERGLNIKRTAPETPATPEPGPVPNPPAEN